MTAHSTIEWTDASWNPLRGCARVSEGCRHCYAETLAKRFSGPGLAYEGVINRHGAWNGKIELLPHKLGEPIKWMRGRRIFVNSMSDLFHEAVPFEFIAQVFAVMACTQRHTYQILTKRPQRMREWFGWLRDASWDESYEDMQANHPGFFWPHQLRIEDVCKKPKSYREDVSSGWDSTRTDWPLPNVWLGVSAEDQATANERIPYLIDTPAAVRFVSAEPLLGAIDFHQASNRWQSHLHQIIVGGESGPGARPMHPDWARSLRDQCVSAQVPFFFKQWGDWLPAHCDGNLEHEPIEINASDVPVRVGKKASGRTLDGRIWDEYPGVQA